MNLTEWDIANAVGVLDLCNMVAKRPSAAPVVRVVERVGQAGGVLVRSVFDHQYHALDPHT